MLKDLVRERLIAAADEIFGLFEGTIASYEEQLCRVKAETERQRRQLEAVCNTQIVLRVQDVQQPICHPEELPRQSQWGCSSLEQEGPQHLHVKEEAEEANVSKLPLTRVSVKSEDEPPESSQLHHESPSGDHFGGSPPDNLLAPLSDSDDMEEPLRSDKNCEDVQQPICRPEELPHQSQCSSLEKEDPQHLHVKEEEEEEEADGGKLPLTRVSLKSEDEPPEWSQLHHQSPSGDNCGGPPPDNLLAPLSDSDDMEEPLRSDENCKKGNIMKHIGPHSGEKPFSCTTCGTPFRRKQHLEIHLRKHTGKKLFRCLVCGKEIINKSAMVRHMRIHTGEKPFSCSVCSKPFIEKGNMMKHMRVHTGEKPFTCPTCGKTFSRKQHLEIHEDTHRRNTL